MTKIIDFKPIKLANTTKLTHKEWLEMRKSGIGGSDVSALLGLNKYKGSFQLWLEKTGELSDEIEENEAMYFGKELEDFVARQYAKKTGHTVKRNNFLMQHPTYKFMLANIDREVIDESGEKGVLEIKTASEWLLKEWDDTNVPEAYMLQLQHYLAVTGLSYGKIAVLIGGNKFKHYHVERDEELIQMLIEAEREFWEKNVLGQVKPEIDGLTKTTDLLNILFPAQETDKENLLQLDFKTDMILEELEDLKREKKLLEEAITEKENKIAEQMREYEKAESQSFFVTWKGQERTSFDQKTFKIEHPELAEKYSKKSWTKRSLKYKVKGE